jgi:hypothetical protein
LCHDPFYLNLPNPADELIARANSPELGTALGRRSPFVGEAEVPV